MPDLAQLRSLYDQLAPAPGTTYGTLLPIARDDATGEYRLALPTQLRDTAMGWLDLLAGPKTGEVTPLASLALMNTPIAAPGGSLGANAVMRTARAADAQAAKSIAANASQKAARQAWVWKEPGGKFVVNSGARPNGAEFVGRQIDDEWFGSGLMAKTGNKETTAASAAGRSLPMDEASRAARAKAMGFDTDGYHATAADITKFKSRGFAGKNVSEATDRWFAETAKIGHWFSDHDISPSTGSSVVYPSLLKIKNPYRTTLVDLRNSIKEHGSASAFRKQLIDGGYDGVQLKDQEFGGTSYVVFKPNQIRSRFAAFDPAKADSADLLASRAGLGLPIVPLDSGYASLNEQLSGGAR